MLVLRLTNQYLKWVQARLPSVVQLAQLQSFICLRCDFQHWQKDTHKVKSESKASSICTAPFAGRVWQSISWPQWVLGISGVQSGGCRRCPCCRTCECALIAHILWTGAGLRGLWEYVPKGEPKGGKYPGVPPSRGQCHDSPPLSRPDLLHWTEGCPYPPFSTKGRRERPSDQQGTANFLLQVLERVCPTNSSTEQLPGAALCCYKQHLSLPILGLWSNWGDTMRSPQLLQGWWVADWGGYPLDPPKTTTASNCVQVAFWGMHSPFTDAQIG